MLTTTQRCVNPQYNSSKVRSDLRSAFCEDQYVRLPNLFPASVLAMIKQEVSNIENEKAERRMVMPGYDTPRYMHTIGGKTIRRSSQFLTSLYESDDLRSMIADITGGTIYSCMHPSEFMVLNFLLDQGSTHGWHVDDPAFALVVVLEAPLPVAGGMLELIPNWQQRCEVGNFSEGPDLPSFLAALRAQGHIQVRTHQSGEAFLIRADKALHRVTPLKWFTHRRVVLNFAYENTATPTYGVSASLIYD